MHAVTHPSARGRGIFVELERKHEREATEMGVACVLAFASAPTAPLFLGPLGWTAIGKLRVWARPASGERGRPRAYMARRETTQPPRWPNHVVRDGEYLRWRYLDSPRGYELFSTDARLRGRLAGEAAQGADDLRRRRSRRLDRACCARLAARAQARFQFALPAPEQRRAYLAAGFLPTPQTLNFMGKALAGRLNTDPRAWRVTLGDTDFF